MRLPRFVVLAALAAGTDAHAAIFTVGGAGCTHDSIANALAAANQNAGPDVIRISRMLNYTQQAIAFTTGQELEIEGGYETCASAQAGSTVLDGAGGAEASVLSATLNAGALLTLRNLTLRNGDASGDGGGLAVRGAGLTRLYDVAIVNNTARLGGGIYAEGGPRAQLVVGAGTLVVGNVARRNGGGLYVDDVDLSIKEPRTYIANNAALGAEDSDGLGGGVLVRACDQSLSPQFASPGLNGAGFVSGNSAARGGGIAGVVGNDCQASLRLNLYHLDGQEPPRVFDNLARVAGGGLYVRSNIEFFDGRGDAEAWLRHAIIEGNVAPRGAAIQLARDSALNGDNGTSLFVNFETGSFPSDAAPCPAGTICTRIVGNESEDANGVRQDGSTIESEDDLFEYVFVRGALFQANVGRSVIRTVHELRLESSAIVDNDMTEAAVVLRDPGNGTADAAFRDVTIAGNRITGESSIRAQNRDVLIERSIVWEPGKLALVRTDGGTIVARSVISNDLTTLVGAGSGRTIDEAPRFVDPANGDYRLRAASPAVDFDEALAGNDRDLAQAVRDVGLTIVPDRFGPRDLGAYERVALAPLELNGDVRPVGALPSGWTLLTPFAAFSSDNAPDSSAGTGSIALAGATGPLVSVAQQCIEIPGPATYYANATGRTVGAIAQNRDQLGVAWSLHRGEGCTGAVIASGTQAVANGTSWGRNANTSPITVTAADWTRTTSVLLTLRVLDVGVAAGSTANGSFDRITLTVGPPPGGVFQDGFED